MADPFAGKPGVYGLQLRAVPAKKSAPAPARPSVFGDDDDEDEPTVEEQIAAHAARKQADHKVAEMHAAALAEDAGAFEYDAHFDAMAAARAAPAAAEKLARAPRYVAALMATAEERRREQEVLMERRLAKERAVEDHLYGDKEKFVTSAYRAKMAEEAAWKAGRAAAEAEEAANAVELRGHMGDFYRGVLRGNGAQGPVAAAAAAPAAEKAVERPVAVEPAEAVERPAAAAERREGGAAPPAEGAAAAPAGGERPAEGAAAAPAGGERPAEGGGSAAAAAAAAAAPAAPAAPPEAAEAAAPPEPPRARDDAVAAARERYLARKRKAAGGGEG